MINSKKRIVTRYERNPIITNDLVPYSCRGVYNSSAVKYNNQYYMVLRCEGYDLRDYFMVAVSRNGYDDWRIKGDIIPMPDTEEFRIFGDNYYDPRITRIEDTFYITFCCHADEARMALMTTKDFENFEWRGFITGYGYRNTVLFPEKINGLYMALERPNCIGNIWMTSSPDLRFWGDHKLVLKAGKESVGVWGISKIGPCGTPIRTDQGWLIIFHGVQTICDYEYLYHTGVMLTELADPSRIIRVGKEPILSPEETYELTGHAPNVVFASSHIVEKDGSVKLYYGASDRYQCVADTSIPLLLEAALER
ncbi:putative GH43/DUF377 family glycosyl hydrolase [Anaerotaenia torta]|uniref:glycoside hydrolase family 130 protein n=1 Tax=Anaerotaenia torta TaxID=433293 RepID=UPI003D2010D7